MSDDDIINTLYESDLELINIKKVCQTIRAGNMQVEEKINNKKKISKRKKSPKRSPTKKGSKKTNLKHLSPEQNYEKLSKDRTENKHNENNDSKFSFLSRDIDEALTNFMSNSYYEQAIRELVDLQLKLAEDQLNNCIKTNFPENSISDDEKQKQNESPNTEHTKAPTKSRKPGKKPSKTVQSKKMVKKK